ncbi:MAG: hypothetical protein GY725_06075 [bacterium]|nr:hypothetical protein [bacterium]
MEDLKPLFGTHRDDPLDSGTLIELLEAGLRGTPTEESPLEGMTERPARLLTEDLEDQFIVFQFNDQDSGKRIIETSSVEPALDGNDDNPDVNARLQLASFHLGTGHNLKEDTRATLRLDFGKDKDSNSSLDTVFWSIAAGMELYEAHKKKAPPKEMGSDFSEAFAHRPIEIPGGLSQISFEVIKHREPPWWKKVFSFLTSGTGTALTSAIGFPGITTQAVSFVDELLGRLHKSEPEVLFKSHPMTLALSKRAKSDYTGGLSSVRLGSLRQGFCLIARGRDFKTVHEYDPIYYPSYGKLVPKDVTPQDLVAGNYEDPFGEMTYAVLRLVLRETKFEMLGSLR